MSKKDYYEVLGLKKSATATEIKKAYRNLAKELHPDKNPNNESAKTLFQEIQEAYDTLYDENKRADYDQFGHQTTQEKRQRENPFGNHTYSRPIRYGETMILNIKLTLEQMHTGVKKTFKYNRNDKCVDCHGHGGTDGRNCGICNGNGFVIRGFNTPIGVIEQTFPCTACSGEGIVYQTKCNTCKSSGLQSLDTTIDIDIPSGIDEGATFIMTGKGQGIKGGENGDLHIRIFQVPHELYTRASNGDLKMNLKLSYTQLVLGDKVEIDTIEGGRIRIPIPPFSDVGDNLRVPTKGLNRYQSGARGDLTVTLGILMPKELNDSQKEILGALKNFENK
jgi:molecular chaperone DnaJ